VIGLDWRVDLGEAWRGLDTAWRYREPRSCCPLGPEELIEREARRILDKAESRPGHIFNLGHGILPNTPVDHVARLIDTVHGYGSKQKTSNPNGRMHESASSLSVRRPP